MWTGATLIGAVLTLYCGAVLRRRWKEKKERRELRDRVKSRLGVGAENGHPL